jgi:hypothetical protein
LDRTTGPRVTSLVAAGHGAPWYACGYLVATAVLSVGATLLLNPIPAKT